MYGECGAWEAVGRHWLSRGTQPNGPVFQPYEPDHNQVDDGEQNQANTTRQGEAVDLIDDESTEDEQGNRICPSFVSEQRGDNKYFDDAMAEQVYGHEVFAANGEMARGMAKMIGNEIMRIFGDLILGEQSDHVNNRSWADRPQRNAASDLQDPVQPLQQHADAEQKFS